MELTYDNARIWAESANKGKDIYDYCYDQPFWNWQSGFKLNIEGQLLSVDGMFSPPNKNNGDWWEGTIRVILLKKEILAKDFKCNTLDELKADVDLFIKSSCDVIAASISEHCRQS